MILRHRQPFPILRRASCLASLCCLFLVLGARLLAHVHVDIGPDAAQPSRLAMSGATATSAVYVPPGEPFSGYLSRFPGGYYASELTFSAEDPDGSLARVELLSVSGPEGGSLSFWEVGATSPTWTRATGWTATASDRPAIVVYEDGSGYGHIHGRALAFTRPGAYTAVFRAIDDSSARTPSLPYAVTFEVLATPQLAIRVENGVAKLSFASRADLTYDLQVSTDLASWTAVPAHRFVAGTGALVELDDALADRPRVFYRLVEYY